MSLELRHAWRSLRKARGLTFTIVATLALGIGANVAIFSVVFTMLFKPLPYRDADRLAYIWLGASRNGPMSGPDFRDIREGSRSFSELGGIWASGTVALTDRGAPEELRTSVVTPNFFHVLGVDSALGRTFTPGDNAPGAPPTVLLAWDLFQRRFGGDPSIVGRQILVSDQPTTVIGVMPKSFRLLLPADSSVPDHLQVWQPVWREFEQGPRGNQFLRVVGRMRPGVTIEQARAEVDSIAHRIAPGHAFTTVALQADDIKDIRVPLLALLVGVALLLVIACVNVGGLLMARAAARANEIAVRLALGSSRGRLIRQLMGEAFVLAVVSTLLGLVVGYGVMQVLVVLAPDTLSRIDMSQIDATTIFYSCGISLLVIAVLTALPAAHQLRGHAPAVLANLVRRSGLNPVRYRARAALVIVQAALSIVLLVGTVLLVRAFVDLQHLDVGFHADRRLTFRVALPESRFSNTEALLNGSDELRRRIAAVPGVISIGAISHLPYDDLPNWGLTYAVDTTSPREGWPRATTRAITTGLLETIDAELVEGRRFTDADSQKNPVVIVDDLLAARLWPGKSAVGQRVLVGQANPDRAATVVGVVRHLHLRRLLDDPAPQLFIPYRVWQRSPMAYVVRTQGDPAALAATIRAEVASFDSRLPIYDVRPLESYMAGARSILRFTMQLAMMFAIAALALTCIGIYGVLAYAVASRRPEFGLRRALGANTAQVMWDVAREGMGFTLVGYVAGVVLAIFTARLLETQLYTVHPGDPIAYVAALGLIVIGAAVACWIPGRRATTISPLDALRAE